MNLKFWSHKNGFRSPTEQQLVRWETDGGNYRECEQAVLFDGRLYNSAADLMRSRVHAQLKRAVDFVHDRIESRFDQHTPSSNY